MKQYFDELGESIKTTAGNLENIDLFNQVVSEIVRCIKNNRKLLIAGNGGSSSQAQHFSSELVGRYKMERKGYAALALTTDTSVITAWSNDYSFEAVFSRQIEAIGQKGDIFIGLSTSGNSKNIIEAVNYANSSGILTICLLGKDGGKLKNLCKIPVIVPSDNTPRIQEIHLLLIHSICEEVEKLLT